MNLQYELIPVEQGLPEVEGKYYIKTKSKAKEMVHYVRMHITTDDKGKVKKHFEVYNQVVTHWFKEITI